LAFTAEATAVTGQPVVLYRSDSPTPMLLSADGMGLRAVQGSGTAIAAWSPGQAGALAVLDWNHDFLPDLALAGTGGVRLLLQTADGRFTDSTPTDGIDASAVSSLWPAD